MSKMPQYLSASPGFKNFFFLDGQLHKLVKVHKPKDLCIAYAYTDQKEKRYFWHEVRRRKRPAFSIGQVAKIVGRSPKWIRHYINEGVIEPPQQARRHDYEGERALYFFDEERVTTLHTHIANHGRQAHTPGPDEVRRNLKQKMLYMRDESGNYIPIWVREE